VQSDEIGIVAAGVGVDGHGYVFSDATLRASPAEWSRRVCQIANEYDADRIVAESNYGGGMVEHTLHTADANLPVRLVTASRGKTLRAEPVAAMYESVQDSGPRVHHVGRFSALEDEMANFSVYGYQGDRSPNRADALVFALTDLMLRHQPKRPSLSLAGERIPGAHAHG
jgi:phage terminase large subunit-like protein